MIISNEERVFAAHVSDLAELSRRTGTPRFTRFLTEREQTVAAEEARSKCASPIFYGGYDGAVRTVCGFFEGTYAEEMPNAERFPMRAVTFSFRKCGDIGHRDFLGAVLNTGLSRSMVGDILVAEDHAVVFCMDTAEELVLGLTKVGRTGVSASSGITGELPKAKVEIFEKTVSSLRLDCVVGACVNCSREKSASLVKSGLVSADFSVCLSTNTVIKEGCVLSIRGHGKFRLAEIEGETRKGRIRIMLEKYA